MRDWDISVPYLLPRIVSVKRIRSNTLPAKAQKPTLRTAPPEEEYSNWTTWRYSDYFYPDLIPDPDYSDTDSDEVRFDDNDSGSERLKGLETMEDDSRRRFRSGGSSSRSRSLLRASRSQAVSQDELIQPRKPSNPYLESTERKNLHKELKFNQKYGKSGSQKTELQAALEKYTEGKVKRDLAASRRTSLEKILEQQAQKIEKHEKEGDSDSRPAWIERLQRQHTRDRTDPKTDEFFRVHARVVNSFMTNDSEESSPSSASPSESE